MDTFQIIQIVLILVIAGVTLKITKVLLTHSGPKEKSIVGPEPTMEDLYTQIDYLCDEHRKVVADNKRLMEECKALRERSVYNTSK